MVIDVEASLHWERTLHNLGHETMLTSLKDSIGVIEPLMLPSQLHLPLMGHRANQQNQRHEFRERYSTGGYTLQRSHRKILYIATESGMSLESWLRRWLYLFLLIEFSS